MKYAITDALVRLVRTSEARDEARQDWECADSGKPWPAHLDDEVDAVEREVVEAIRSMVAEQVLAVTGFGGQA